MRAINGYIEDGRFTPYEAVDLPRRANAILVIQDTVQSLKRENDRAWLDEFHRMAAESADENDVFNDEAFARRPGGRELVTFSDEVGL